MSKSAPPRAAGVIRLLDPSDVVRRKIARAVTDSGQRVEPGAAHGPGVANLVAILAACTGQTLEEAAARAGSYRELKQACAEAVTARLAPLQARYAVLDDDPQIVTRALQDGAERARSVADGTLARAKSAIGLLEP
jgi:tryptophanyl-tRNA synthetase